MLRSHQSGLSYEVLHTENSSLNGVARPSIIFDFKMKSGCLDQKYS
jgi:hypothetical protein